MVAVLFRTVHGDGQQNEGRMAIQVKLAPALEKFAEDCVAEGRYGDLSEVVETSLRLLQMLFS